MKVAGYEITNMGRFDKSKIWLAPRLNHSEGNVTVFVGNNGAGKTTLLRSLATSLSWLVARIRSETGNGSPISEKEIKNGTSQAEIHVACDVPSLDKKVDTYDWKLVKAKRGRKSKEKSSLSNLDILADRYRESLTNDDQTSLPLVAFYDVERVVLDIPLKIRGKHSFDQIDGYDNSLSKGVDFRRFFEWFREREDSENESAISDEIWTQLSLALGKNDEVWKQLNELKASSKDRQLTAVRTAISSFMPGFSNLRVRRKPRLQMSVDKDGETLNVEQLSQGEKSLMALVGDLARRLAMMNPNLDNPLRGEGIVLIDEVDMHLHPRWQRTLIDRLIKTFPNCQFVLTTHSPLVVSDSPDLLVYLLDDGKIRPVTSLYGEDANSVLLDLMDTDIRNANVSTKFGDILDAIQNKEIDNAHSMIAELEPMLQAGNIELAKIRLLLRKQELRNEKNK